MIGGLRDDLVEGVAARALAVDFAHRGEVVSVHGPAGAGLRGLGCAPQPACAGR
jgi:hypothetical protein